MAEKVWIKLKKGLSADPKHRERIGTAIWAYIHMIDRADWETGMVHDWRDQAEADLMGVGVNTMRDWRQKLANEVYIECIQKQHSLDLRIFRWVNPRSYEGGPIVNPRPLDMDDDTTTEGDVIASPSESQGSRKLGTPTSSSSLILNGGVPPTTLGKIQKMPLEWQLAAVDNGTIKFDQIRTTNDHSQFELKAQDAANLIDMQAAGTGPLALAFMLTREIIFTNEQVKGQRKAARELLVAGVLPKHVVQATKDLMGAVDRRGKPFVVVDLFSIKDIAISLAHPAPEQGPVDTRKPLPVFRDGKPVFEKE